MSEDPVVIDGIPAEAGDEPAADTSAPVADSADSAKVEAEAGEDAGDDAPPD